MAEGLFNKHVEEAGLADRFEIDSAGTGNWHVGELPDARMRQTAQQHGLTLTSRARQFQAEDHQRFDHILAMDASNLAEINRRVPASASKAEVQKMLAFSTTAPDSDVPDPYYGGPEGFEQIYQLLDAATATLLAHLRRRHGL